VPQALQNLAVAAFSALHLKHFWVLAGTGGFSVAAALQSVPHALQNFALSELMELHFEQFMGRGSLLFTNRLA